MYTNSGNFPMLPQVVYIAIHHFAGGIWKMYTTSRNEPFSPLFLNETPPESPRLWSISWDVAERISFINYAAAKKNIESQVPPIFMYGRCHVFYLCSLFFCSKLWVHWTSAYMNLARPSRMQMLLPLLLQSMCLKKATKSTCLRHPWLIIIPTPRPSAC